MNKFGREMRHHLRVMWWAGRVVIGIKLLQASEWLMPSFIKTDAWRAGTKTAGQAMLDEIMAQSFRDGAALRNIRNGKPLGNQ